MEEKYSILKDGRAFWQVLIRFTIVVTVATVGSIAYENDLIIKLVNIGFATVVSVFWIYDFFLLRKENWRDRQNSNQKHKELMTELDAKSQREKNRTEKLSEMRKKSILFSDDMNSIIESNVESIKQKEIAADEITPDTIEALKDRWEPVFEYLDRAIEDKIKERYPAIQPKLENGYSIDQFFQQGDGSGQRVFTSNIWMNKKYIFDNSTIFISACPGLVYKEGIQPAGDFKLFLNVQKKNKSGAYQFFQLVIKPTNSIYKVWNGDLDNGKLVGKDISSEKLVGQILVPEIDKAIIAAISFAKYFESLD